MDRLRPNDPENIGPYKLIARLGAGGMGVVFLGTKGTDRAAIKVVRNSFLDDPSLKTRFVREIETLKKIDSPFVAKIVDSSMEEELSWHAVEFVNGPTLRELIDSNGPLTEDLWWELAHQLGEGLAAVHRLGIVHRDIKPANIIMSDTGPKIIDFGISQDSDATSLTMTGTVAGSPAWLSPEQLEGVAITAGSDLYSLGSVLVFAATGQSPWGSETSMSIPAIHQKILTDQINLEGLTASQRELIKNLHAKDPSERQIPASLNPASSPVEMTRENPTNVTQTGAREDSAVPLPSAKSTEVIKETQGPEPLPRTKPRVGLFVVAAGVLGLIVFTALAPWRDSPDTSLSEGSGNSVGGSQNSGVVNDLRTAASGFEFSMSIDLAVAEEEAPNYYAKGFFEEPGSGRLVVFGWLPNSVTRTDFHYLEASQYQYGEEVSSLPLQIESVSPHGELGAFYDGEVSCVLVNLETLTPIAEYEGGESQYSCESAFSADGSRFYFIQATRYDPLVNRVVRVVNLETGLEEEPISVSPNPVEIVIAGDYLIAAAYGPEIDSLQVIRLDDQSLVAEIEVEAGSQDLQVSPDADFVYFTGWRGSKFKILDLNTMAVTEYSGQGSQPRHTAISSNGTFVAWVTQDGVSLYDTVRDVLFSQIKMERATRVGFSRDGENLFIGQGPTVLTYSMDESSR